MWARAGTLMGMIRFEGVTKRYGDPSDSDPGQGSVAVDDLTLEAPTGRITVLVGPSGCGKTTTLRMVNRMITPTAGTISSCASSPMSWGTPPSPPSRFN